MFGDWDAANATCVVQDGTLSSGDRLELVNATLLVAGAMSTDGMLQNDGTVTVQGTLTNRSFILNNPGASVLILGEYVGGGLYNFGGSFVIAPSGSAEFNGFTDISSTPANHGYLSIGGFFAINFNQRTENLGSLDIAPAGEVSNFGILINAGQVDNQGVVHNGASLIELCDSIWTGGAPTGEAPTGAQTILLTADTLTWCAVPDAQGYDVVTGELGSLIASAGNFTSATTECLADSVSTLALPLSNTPATGEGQWFLVRAVGVPSGGYDTVFTSQVGEREAEIDAAAGACP